MPNIPRPLKIGFVFDDSLDSSDGVAQYVKTLGGWLSGRGHEVRYLVGETKAGEWAGGQIYSLSRNQPVTFNGNRLSTPRPASRRRIKQVLSDEQFDVLHVQVPYSPLLGGRVINTASRQMAIIGTFHILPAKRWISFGARSMAVLQWRSLHRFAQLLAVTPAAAKFARSSLGLPSEVMPNVVDLRRLRSTKIANQADKIVFLGRLVERKGARQLLAAFAELHRHRPTAQLVIAGDGPERPALERWVVQHGLADSVEFLGFIDESAKPGLLASAAIACFPSLYGESFGIVLIEAMAAGAGVVLGGDNPGYRSVLGPRQQLLVDPRDSRAFADRLELLLSDQTLAKRLHAWQTDYVKQFDVAVVGPKIEAIYAAAVALKGKTGHNSP